MSWKGFTKAVARLPQVISTKAGYAAETVDPEFLDLEDKLKGLETCVRKLHEDSRKFKEALLLMLDHQKRFAETLLEMFQPISSLKSGRSASQLDLSGDVSKEIETANQMVNSMNKVREELMPQLQDIERLVIAPAGDYITIFEQVKKYLTKRSHKLLDYDRHREAVKKLKEKKDRTSSDEKKLSQLEHTLDDATREYNNYNNILKKELPILIDLRIEFIDPCFATFYFCQVKVYHILHSEFKNLSQYNFDMSCSALNGFLAKKELAESLLEELTIPRRRGSATTSGSPSSPNADEAASAVNSKDSSSPQAGLVSASNTSPLSASAKSTSPGASSFTNAPNMVPIPGMPKPSSSSKQYVVALYDFEAQAEGDLSFKRDDRIEVVEKTSDQNDWWTGRLNGVTGQFPGNYVAIV